MKIFKYVINSVIILLILLLVIIGGHHGIVSYHHHEVHVEAVARKQHIRHRKLVKKNEKRVHVDTTSPITLHRSKVVHICYACYSIHNAKSATKRLNHSVNRYLGRITNLSEYNLQTAPSNVPNGNDGGSNFALETLTLVKK